MSCLQVLRQAYSGSSGALRCCAALTCSLLPQLPTHKRNASSRSSEDRPNFPGSKSSWTEKLEFVQPDLYDGIPVYRVMDTKGKIISPDHDPQLPKEMLVKMYEKMTTLNMMDRILYESQRQGRISFYMTSYGEEGTHIGSAAALEEKDWIYGQYREAGMWVYDQYREAGLWVYGQYREAGLWVYGQYREAGLWVYGQYREAGLWVYGQYREAGLRNNGYAISTPTHEQYRGDGVAARGPSYGIATIRVDGNDVLAVYNVTKAARQIAVQENRPVLIEAMTYRIGHHSTSDDSSAYRSVDEVRHWDSTQHPIARLRTYMADRGYWDDARDKRWKEDCQKQVMQAFAAAERRVKPDWRELFSDVYADMPASLRAQMEEMERHVKEYEDCYPTTKFSGH
ncbi:2-oxoisovalerate dehydrogenase subunit alpha, mitochondrial-like [Hyalella azteca]|uniref:2-oxoisovalerate dehydrogenase subunit alpha n=1 Tax=Hyalella azteca TaxID=294128 RepID=A0A8B7NS16_HYAAZ|nr:2-oxoisovalerate dehydrogenase subunit alpha, mitochondrial-like [Hyalella azteca]